MQKERVTSFNIRPIRGGSGDFPEDIDSPSDEELIEKIMAGIDKFKPLVQQTHPDWEKGRVYIKSARLYRLKRFWEAIIPLNAESKGVYDRLFKSELEAED